MKPPTHPRLTVSGILISIMLNLLGAFFLHSTGNAVLVFIGLAVSLAVWIDIIVDRNRRLPSFYPDEPATNEAGTRN